MNKSNFYKKEPAVVSRIKSRAGQDFNDLKCRVRNPHITARESIQIADYIVGLENYNKNILADNEWLRGALRIVVDELESWMASENDEKSISALRAGKYALTEINAEKYHSMRHEYMAQGADIVSELFREHEIGDDVCINEINKIASNLRNGE